MIKSLFGKKEVVTPTVSSIYEKAAEEVRAVQEAQQSKVETLAFEQANRTAKYNEVITAMQKRFDEDTAANWEATNEAAKEVSMATNVIGKFSELFGVK